MSQEARLMCGLTLILVPTIVYGGLTVLGIVSGGAYGAPGPTALTPLQISLYRAGHAHAGVLMILALVLQIALDSAALPPWLLWTVRVAAPASALLVSGGFFGVAHFAPLRALLYTGAGLVSASTLISGIGLLRRPIA